MSTTPEVVPTPGEYREPPPAPKTHSHLGIALIVLGVLMMSWYGYKFLTVSSQYLAPAFNGLWWIFLGNVLEALFQIHRSIKKLTGEKEPTDDENPPTQ